MPPRPNPPKHRWDLTPQQARALQQELREQVRVEPIQLEGVKNVAGVDASFGGDHVYAGAVLLDFPSLRLIDQAFYRSPILFPYIPGLLSFRETPASLDALARLKSRPDVLIVDGHGMAHPRRFGIACHLGVLSGIPAIGCAKSILVGTVGDLGESPGSIAELRAGGEVLGLALRTRENGKPVYLSIGHLVDLDSALAMVLACIRGHRLPEPAQMAHQLVTQFRKESVQDDQDSSPPS
jgi:deoxyribonuclease V